MFSILLAVCISTIGYCGRNVMATGDDEAFRSREDIDHPFIIQKSLVPLRIVAVRKTRFPRWLDILRGHATSQNPSPKPIHMYLERKVVYPVEKVVPVPLKEYVEVPKPYPVPVVMKRKVPVLLEKKVPVKVEVPVERPFPVEVAVPYEVTVLKKVPFFVEKKVPYQVNVPEYVEVPVPVFDSHEEEKSVRYFSPVNATSIS